MRAGVEHAPVLAALHAESFAGPWSAEEFAALLGQPGVAGWIGQSDMPEGFILVRAAADEAEILTLAVIPSARRKGTASALLKTASDMLRAGGTVRMFLEVAADNTAALALYTRHHFTPCGRRANYYDGRVDAVMMTRALEPDTKT